MMEIEKSPQKITKKLWNIVRIVFHMMKRNTIFDLHLLLKRAKIAGKTLANFIHHHHTYYAALTCRSNDVVVSPRDYEFSCTTTPIYPSFRSKLRKSHQRHVEELRAMQRVFDILNRLDTAVEGSPMSASPAEAVQLMEEDHQVDKDAEEFITKFYKDLKKQKRIAALESPSPYRT